MGGIQYKVLTETGLAGTVEVIANNYSDSITIPKTVENGGITYTITSIGDSAFRDCIPDSVTSIRDFAFAYCGGLTSISIPVDVSFIGDFAFFYCYGLTSVSIPDSVTSIGNYTFANCIELTSISIPDSVTSIDDNAFGFCSGLTSIRIPDSVTFIGQRTFGYCSKLTRIAFSGSTPPFLDTEVFFNAPTGLQIIVPQGAKEAYQTALNGKLPADTVIIEVAIQEVTPDGEDAAVSGSIVITFNEAMNTSEGAVSLDGGTTSLTGGAWSVGDTVYTVPYSGLVYSTGYTIRVSGFEDAVGNAMAEDSSHSFTTEAEPLTPSVSPVSLTVGKSSTVSLTVDLGQGTLVATSAAITVGDGSIVSVSPDSLIADGSATVTGLFGGSTNLTVAFNDTANTSITVPVTVQAAPVWPSGSTLTASGITSAGMILSWTAANDTTAVTGYRIYQNGALIGTVAGNVTVYNVTGLSSSTGYSFRVQAGNAGGLWTADGPYVTATTGATSTGGSGSTASSDDTSTSQYSQTVNGTGIGIDLTSLSLPEGVTLVSPNIYGLPVSTTGRSWTLSLSPASGSAASGSLFHSRSYLNLYEFKLLDENGKQVHNIGRVSIRIPIPAGANSDSLMVLYYDESAGTFVRMNAVVEDGYLVFSTTHFSYYMVTGVSAGRPAIPETGGNNP